MVLSLDTDVDTPPDPTPWERATRSLSEHGHAASVSLPRSLSKPKGAGILSGMIININKVINLFIRGKTRYTL